METVGIIILVVLASGLAFWLGRKFGLATNNDTLEKYREDNSKLSREVMELRVEVENNRPKKKAMSPYSSNRLKEVLEDIKRARFVPQKPKSTSVYASPSKLSRYTPFSGRNTSKSGEGFLSSFTIPVILGGDDSSPRSSGGYGGGGDGGGGGYSGGDSGGSVSGGDSCG